tara:strand:- start:1678 stop:1878 length:201 start_codon:yes stop_codon:yes gene_type:complete
MAFKMRGMNHGKGTGSALNKNSWWKNFKEKVSLGMSNVVGMNKSDKQFVSDRLKRQADELKKRRGY